MELSTRNRDKYEFLTQERVPKAIMLMALPSIISMLTTSIYNMADTFFVGQINTQATAAVGVTFAVMSVIQAVGFFFGQGSGTYISRQLGAKDTKSATRMASTAFIYAIIVGLLIMTLGLLSLTKLSLLLGSTNTILPYTEKFLGCILIGAPFMTGSMVLNNQMRFQGNAGYAMYGMLSGGIVNVILVPLFIFGMDMGILGAGLGTLIGQVCGFVVLFIMSRKGGNLKINPRFFSFSRIYLKEIVRGGTPSLTRQALMAISTSMLNTAVGVYGDAAIAGMSIVTRLTFVIHSVVIGIGQGFQPLCGFCYGAKLYERVKEGYYFSVKVSVAFLLCWTLFGLYFAEEMVHIFRDDMDVVEVGAMALRCQLITFPVVSVIQLSNMMMQTTGNSIPANILAASRNGIFFIPLIIILPYFWGLFGVEICQAVADVFTLALAIPLTYNVMRKMR
ncbi:MAG: MATE family efflux transporter [Bacteroidia bacterium]|nr:MATE family efflux transporter [Bacteroidia bacterium]